MSAQPAPRHTGSEPTASRDPILSIRDLHVRFGGSHVLQGISFDVAPTGVTALLGRNGVGKTTTIKAILGIAPRTGTLTFDGRSMAGWSTVQTVRAGIAYVPEDREVFGGLTVEENLRLVGRDIGSDHPAVRELFPDLVARRAQLAGTLSGGQQQMVSLARVLVRDNRLLLVDEPTKGLAPKLVTEVADVLARVAETTPLLLVEQNLPLVRRIADTVVVIDAGRVVHTGPAAEFVADTELTRELLGVAMRQRGGPPAGAAHE